MKPSSIELVEGQITALMGRNGSGKSSLIKSLLGVIDFEGDVKSFAKKVGYIPQDANDLLYHQSVKSECEQTNKDHKLINGTTENLLQRLAPTINVNSHPRDLSEGQRLALVLSIVLAPEPDLILLDEPTRGLDYESKELLIEQLKNCAARGASILIASHDVELIAELADRIIILAEGEIVADGTALEVLLASPAFAPQVTKVMAPRKWLTINDVLQAME